MNKMILEKKQKNKIEENKNQTNQGSSLLEVLLAIAVFTVGVLSIGLFLLDVLRTTEQSNDMNQALFIAAEGIEAAKYIRDSSFDAIDNQDGSHGLVLTDEWFFNGTEASVSLGDYGKTFTRSIVIDDSGLLDDSVATTSVKLVESLVSWQGRSGTSTISLKTYLTNWER